MTMRARLAGMLRMATMMRQETKVDVRVAMTSSGC